MTSLRMKTNVKLTKLFYKYMDETKDDKIEELSEDKQDVRNKQEVTDEQEIKEYEAYPPYNFSWFIEGKIAAMGWPQTVGNLNYLADVGVNHLITLSPEKVPPILECEKKLKWSEIPIKEFGAPTLKQILKFIETCERAEFRGEVMGVHCRQGRGRTGTMLACYLVHFNNMAPERAILTVRVQRPGSCETYEQERAVHHYHDCLRGTIEKPDYRLVEDKLYFDFSMKYMFDDEQKETRESQEEQDVSKPDDLALVENKIDEKHTIKLKKKKSKAMVINHKIYF